VVKNPKRKRYFALEKIIAHEDWTIGCPETSIVKYHYSLRDNPEERSSHRYLPAHPDISYLSLDVYASVVCKQALKKIQFSLPWLHLTF
jgi:hypothetical protein